MTTFSTGGSAVTFTTSGSAVSFAVTPASNAFTTSAVLTPGAHASTHGAGGADPITTLGTVAITSASGTATTLTVGTATINAGTATNLVLVTPTIGTATATGGTFTNANLVTPTIGTATMTGGTATTLTAAGEIHTGQSIFAAGSAVGPSLAFTGDTNTGIYSPGADQVGIATAGTARVVVDASGNVGIPNASSGVKVAISDGTTSFSPVVNITNNAADASASYLYLRKARNSAIVNASDAIGNIAFSMYDGSAYQIAAMIQGVVDTSPAAGDAPGRLSFLTTADGGTSLAEKMRIDNAGLITGTGTSLGAWTSYTPTVTSGTGTLTTVTSTGYYCQIGKIVHLRARITLTTNGTGATDLRMTMPIACRNVDVRPIGSGRESAITGKQLVIWALQNGSTAYIVFYDNTYPGGDGRSYDLSMTYEIN